MNEEFNFRRLTINQGTLGLYFGSTAQSLKLKMRDRVAYVSYIGFLLVCVYEYVGFILSLALPVY